MKTNSLIISILVVFVLIGGTRFLDDNDYAKDSIILHTNIDNRMNSEAIDNVRVKFLLLDDIPIVGASTANRLRGGDIGSKTMVMDLYGNQIEPGEYWVRIYVYGDDSTRRIKHRPIIIQ